MFLLSYRIGGQSGWFCKAGKSQVKTYRYPRRGIPDLGKHERYRSTGMNFAVDCRHSGQRFSPRLEDKDELSKVALIEALTPKDQDDVKGSGGGHHLLIKVKTRVIRAKEAL
jgi:hypothetical protein